MMKLYQKLTKGKSTHISYQTTIRIVALILSFLLLTGVGLSVFSVWKMQRTVNQEVERYISELSYSVRDTVAQKLESSLDALESVALSYGQARQLGSPKIRSFQERAELLHFTHVTFITPEGNTVSSNGFSHELEPVQGDRIFDVLDGERLVLHSFSEETSSFSLILAVPVYQKDQIVGIMTAHTSAEWAGELLARYYFDGDVFFNIILPDGTELLTSDSPYLTRLANLDGFVNSGNVFEKIRQNAKIRGEVSLSEMIESAGSGTSETLRYYFPADGIPRASRIVRIPHTGLCIWLALMENAVSRNFNELLLQIIVSSILMIFLFSALVVALLKVYRKSLQLAMVDPVTKGYSLTRFELEVEEQIRASAPGQYSFLSVNLTNFKMLNDTYGIADSNRVLKYIHDTISNHLQEGELLARARADHFDMLLLSRPDEEFLQSLNDVVKELNSFNDHLEEKQWLTFRVGVYRINNGSLPIVYIRDRANIARDREKKDTEHMWYSCNFYRDEDRQLLRHENSMRNKMRSALAQHCFIVYLQPKTDIATRRIVGAEALVRWQDKEWGLIPPDEFIPLFEKNGFIRVLDLYVFEVVCLYLRSWIDAGVRPVPVSVNLSRVHLQDRNFLRPFIEVQKKYRIPSELLEIELTETVFQNSPGVAMEAIRQIHQAGYLCSLDDFGSGYSSLNNLKTLDIDILKLDKNFFSTLSSDNKKERIILEELVHMAKRLGIRVCCEGIETEDHYLFLQQVLCDIGQGYLFSRPVEVSAFEQMVYGKTILKRDESTLPPPLNFRIQPLTAESIV